MRPQQLLAYSDPQPPVWRLAAAYGYGFAKNHCFPDGNKRIALAVIDVFLQLNGYELVASEEDAALTIQSLAAGQVTELDLASWIEENCKRA
jgi:death on curing protein